MQFLKAASLLALAAIAQATNTVQFQSLDNVDRVIVFTANAGLATIPNLSVPAGQTVPQVFPTSWVGNAYAIKEGDAEVPGILAEFAWNAWGGINFFDVSAIVNPSAVDGISEIFPQGSNTPSSGCGLFPCDNAYYQPNDVQTKATTEDTLICTLNTNGASTNQQRDIEIDERGDFPAVSRRFAFGKDF